jgi:SulP family sulfate permease
VLAAAIADTENELAERAEREEEEEEQQHEEEGARARAAACSSPTRLSFSARLAAFAGPTAQTDVIYGIINAVVGIPAMVSFAAIVFVHPTYKPVLGQLARFSFLSAAVHQLCFAAMSSLKFAVGQPQDTGLILLSAIATSVAEMGLDRGLSARVVVATALVATAASTLFVGLGTLGVARLRLAGLVQYVPLPVVGGYLSFVGWFCFVAGVGLGAGVELGAPATWLGLLAADALPKLVATLAAACAILLCMRRARSPWALPALLGLIPCIFFAVLLATGTSLEKAQDDGWVIRPPQPSSPSPSGGGQKQQLQPFWDLYDLFFTGSGLCIPALVRQIPRAIALWFIVVFGSTLDIAAIQASTPEPLDFNRELRTVGMSNVVCSLTGGGFTGSYLFSQTAFSMKAGVGGPLHGLIIGGLELFVFLLPVPVVQYLPNFFIGALLAVFGVEITSDWLVHSRSKVTRSEYLLLVATFALIVWLGLGGGVAGGAVLCLAYFALSYSRVHLSAFRAFSSRSAAARPIREHRALEGAFAGRMAAVSLSGFVFFGSSVKIMDRVLRLAREMGAAGGGAGATTTEATAGGAEGGGGGEAAASAPALAAAALLEGGRDEDARPQSPLSGGSKLTTAAHRHQQQQLLLTRVAANAPRFLLLDFRRVLGVDATAAQTFGTLQTQLRRLGVELVLTRVRGNPTVERLFAAHGLIAAAPPSSPSSFDRSVSDGGRGNSGDDDGATLSLDLEPGPERGYCRHFDTLNDAARYAEERFLALARAAGALPAQDAALTLREFLAGHLLNSAAGEEEDEEKEDDGVCGDQRGGQKGVDAADQQRPSFGFAALGGSRRAVDAAAEGIARHSSLARFSPGQTLFDYGANPDVVYLILKGQVDVEMHGAATAAGVPAPMAVAPRAFAAATAAPASGSAPGADAASPSSLPPAAPRHYQCGVGAVVGGTDAVLQRPRAFRAVAASEVEAVAVASAGYRAMAREAPAAARALQAILLRDACLGEVYAYEALRRAAD